ncbi:MAG: IS3 family transposase [Chlorobium sp.]|nr:IS3 family transposase [Chlorobium sp.]
MTGCRYATRIKAETSIREYIEMVYNRQRRHSRLGFLAPAVFAQNCNARSASTLNASVHY